MSGLWFVLFAALFLGYFALEGANIGLGLLLPVLGRTGADRARLVASLGPLALAGEVWLVALGGVLFGVFPALEGEVLSDLYAVVVVLLLSWVVRDAGIWLRKRAAARAWRLSCDALITAGSVALVCAWGLVLTALVHDLRSPWHRLPEALLFAVLLGALLIAHGAVFAARRLADPVATALAGRLGPLARVEVTGVVAALPALAVLVGTAGHLLDNAAPHDTLAAISWIALPVLPFVAAVQWWAWRTLSRPANPAVSFF